MDEGHVRIFIGGLIIGFWAGIITVTVWVALAYYQEKKRFRRRIANAARKTDGT